MTTDKRKQSKTKFEMQNILILISIFVYLYYYFLLQKSDKHGISPLLAAIWEGHTTCVRVLLENGASKDGKAPDGTSYIDAAEKNEIRELLS